MTERPKAWASDGPTVQTVDDLRKAIADLRGDLEVRATYEGQWPVNPPKLRIWKYPADSLTPRKMVLLIDADGGVRHSILAVLRPSSHPCESIAFPIMHLRRAVGPRDIRHLAETGRLSLGCDQHVVACQGWPLGEGGGVARLGLCVFPRARPWFPQSPEYKISRDGCRDSRQGCSNPGKILT